MYLYNLNHLPVHKELGPSTHSPSTTGVSGDSNAPVWYIPPDSRGRYKMCTCYGTSIPYLVGVSGDKICAYTFLVSPIGEFFLAT